MPKWTPETSSEFLTSTIAKIDELKKLTRLSADHTRWLFNCTEFIEEVFGRNTKYYKTFVSIPWTSSGKQILDEEELIGNIEEAIERRNHAGYLRSLDFAKGLLLSCLDQLKSGHFDLIEQRKENPDQSNLVVRLLNAVERRLRKLIRDIPSKEKEVQDAFENLLIGMDVPYSREKTHVEYSSKNYIPDFTIEEINLAIEIKLCASATKEKELISEINDDIVAYGSKFRSLLFIVYDLGHVRDVEKFTTSFEKSENVMIRVVKH